MGTLYTQLSYLATPMGRLTDSSASVTASGCLPLGTRSRNWMRVGGPPVTCGQYHKFVYVCHRGISRFIRPSSSPFSPPESPPRHRHHGIHGGNKRDCHPIVTADAKEVVKTITGPTNNPTHIMCSQRQLL